MSVRTAIAVAWVTLMFVPGPGGRAPADVPLFVDAAASAGLTFTHANGASGRYYIVEEMGAGAALFDYDNDGDLDVFLVQGGPLGGADRRAIPASRLFRNDLKRDAAGQPRLH